MRRVSLGQAGKLADLVVPGKNLFEVPPHEIHRVRVLMTMMNGKVVHGITGGGQGGRSLHPL